MVGQKSDLAVWLAFIQTFVWPMTIVVALSMFRTQIISLIDRLSSVKGFGWEVTAYQQAAPDAKKSPPVNSANIVSMGNETFLTETGVRAAIRDGADLAPSDEIYRTMRIFSTPSQTTWLAFSKQKLFLVLDDASTRASGRLVQWVLPRSEALPVVTRPRSPGLGLIDIGPRKNWLYSTNLFATPDYLQKEVTNAINEGNRPAAPPV